MGGDGSAARYAAGTPVRLPLLLSLLLLLLLKLMASAELVQVHARDLKSEDGPEVRVDQGILRGVWVLGAASTEIKFAAFRGIPYAAPPVGPLRFKGPRPFPGWTGVREAVSEASSCPQGHPDLPDGVHGDEDCLYLNVYVPLEAVAEVLETSEAPEITEGIPSEASPTTTVTPTTTPAPTMAPVRDAANDTVMDAVMDAGQDQQDQPTRPPRKLLPVLFFVHGVFSWFQKGSSSEMDLGPELLLQHDVMVVTPGYRLGALGFASLDTDGVPGNAGLKDVLAALRWVRRNAAAFGGDPDAVTVAGHGSGAALAHYITLVPAASGLARAAILQSGSALAQWAFTQDHVNYATELAAWIDPESISISNDTEAVETVLRNASVAQLLRAYPQVASSGPTRAHRVNFIPFVASPERRVPNPEAVAQQDAEDVFLAHDPEYLVLKRAVPSVPVLMGITSQEALLRFCNLKWDLFPERMEIYNKELEHLLPLNLWPSDDTAALFNVQNVTRSEADLPSPTFPPELRDIADQVREEYLAGANVTNSSTHVVQLLNDVFFNADVHRLAIRRVQAAAQPTYLYRFNVEDEYNLGRNRRRLDRPGAVHSDEMGYLWRVEGLGQNITADTSAALILRRLTMMWTNFVKTGSPVPEPSDLLPEAWPPTEADTLPNQAFLDIGEKIQLKIEPLGGHHMNFWRTVYRNLRNGGGL